jgi:hypothetical protein
MELTTRSPGADPIVPVLPPLRAAPPLVRLRTVGAESDPPAFIPGLPSAWNDAELNEAILTLCDEIPDARMLACWRALQHCRTIPRGTAESLLVAMRESLRRQIGSTEHPFAVVA